MSRKSVEAALARGVELLDRLLPLKTWLYFPILYAASVWAVRRVFDTRDRILGWQVWLDPEFVRTKPDGFVLDFFTGQARLAREYAAEIERGDLRTLRAAFPALYSIIGLEDAFLRALFKAELDALDYRTIVVEFAARTVRARDAIVAAASDPSFWDGLARVCREAASLGLHLLKDDEVQDLILSLIKGPAVLTPVVPPEAKNG